jgi:hypothetical protein
MHTHDFSISGDYVDDALDRTFQCVGAGVQPGPGCLDVGLLIKRGDKSPYLLQQ